MTRLLSLRRNYLLTVNGTPPDGLASTAPGAFLIDASLLQLPPNPNAGVFSSSGSILLHSRGVSVRQQSHRR